MRQKELYEAPEIEVLELTFEQAVLIGSGEGVTNEDDNEF